ncbi:MAG: hypothetical protein E7672_04060 [Ruminococcaceae bacterium]|nr:hypothetical protein [Oscillospiraceae bacterium]
MATFFNQATLSYSGGVVNSNITTGEIIEVLSATKTAVVSEYSQGSVVTYAINIINSGNTSLTGLSVTDNLGEYAFGTESLQPLDYVEGSVNYFINGVLQADPAVTVGPPLVFSGINVPADGVTTIIYSARVNGFAPPIENGQIENTAVISGNGITDITVTETVTAEAEPRLNITKSVSPTIVEENGQITYTFVIQNTGNTPAVATDNAVVTDTFDPILRNITVTYNGAAWSSPADYTYDETIGLFSTVVGAITVPAATYTQDTVTGRWIVDPGVAVITVTGTI